MNEYVVTTKKVCTSRGLWIPQGHIFRIISIIDPIFCKIEYMDSRHIIYLIKNKKRNWHPLKITRLLKLIESSPICM